MLQVAKAVLATHKVELASVELELQPGSFAMNHCDASFTFQREEQRFLFNLIIVMPINPVLKAVDLCFVNAARGVFAMAMVTTRNGRKIIFT